ARRPVIAALYTFSLTTLFRSRFRLSSRVRRSPPGGPRVAGRGVLVGWERRVCAAAKAPPARARALGVAARNLLVGWGRPLGGSRSEEHTSELQSREKLVCRLL